MVKELDEKKLPPLRDHVGWLLHQANEAWRREFEGRLAAMGHVWISEARANVLMHVGRSGIAQSKLVRHLALSKQAVQQLLDHLEADEVVERRPDPGDRRGCIVVFTRKGRKFLNDAETAKQAIEDQRRKQLGEKRFRDLCAALDELGEQLPQ